ncbi:hypothetical protein F444_21914 [Phytophthora nicotianae P1976]|uniref:Guanylate-binding protein N-terminal domain-containing protein n=1 Tax=Phytophthora nicotianae P1976 TaxID=1317066 RepID=A0A080YZI0_PHYNI|nr:hypothetical protein F444_21914 [Phytophthora nicotianae P1976]
MCFADELVLGRAGINGEKRLLVDSISSEDHRKLPSAAIENISIKGLVAVGCVDDVLYVVDPSDRAIYASKLSVTVRSDAYRIQRSGQSKSQDYTRLNQQSGDNTAEHWLRVIFHVFEKFPAQSFIDAAINPNSSCSLDLGIVVDDTSYDNSGVSDTVAVCGSFLSSVMTDLRRLNKPLSDLDLAKTINLTTILQTRSIGQLLTAIVSFVPVQICRAEDNMLRLLRDDEDDATTGNEASRTSLSSENDSTGTDASEIAQSIRFGLLSPLLESWNGRCVVVTSMGKQSTGKSYFLNHLAGTSFAISGSRCTDGAWLSLRFVSDVLLVVLDFEGLGSFERSEQEDIFLSVLNASVSLFTVFRMESRFDKDIDGLFSRFQKGVQLIKNDPRLFRGLLFMSVIDVNMNDRLGVVNDLAAKLNAIFESSREQNFLTEMYAGQVTINCTPPFGTVEYYQSMENDAAKALLSIVREAATGFSTGKAFLDCLRIVLAKISMLDWTSMDKSTQYLVISDVKQKLPGILRTGCHVPQTLVADATISSGLKESVLQVGTRDKLVVSLTATCQAYPGFATKWMALNNVILLDTVADDAIDFGFDVTALETRSTKQIHTTLVALFKLSWRKWNLADPD